MAVSWLPIERHCVTPLGPAVAIGVVDDIEDVEWVTIIDATGEPFFWRNTEVRFTPHVTNGRPDVSPFGKPSAKLQRQIDRYVRNGWLPKPPPAPKP